MFSAVSSGGAQPAPQSLSSTVLCRRYKKHASVKTPRAVRNIIHVRNKLSFTPHAVPCVCNMRPGSRRALVPFSPVGAADHPLLCSKSAVNEHGMSVLRACGAFDEPWLFTFHAVAAFMAHLWPTPERLQTNQRRRGHCYCFCCC